MAVVVVIGILSIVALPSYRQYVLRAQRTEAKSALLRLATNQERYYLGNRTYGTVAQLAQRYEIRLVVAPAVRDSPPMVHV